MSVPPPAAETEPEASARSGGIADEIRSLVESGSPQSLSRALDFIRSRELGETEFGRIMNAVIVNLIQKVYPSLSTPLPLADPPLTHLYTQLIREADKGNYTPPSAFSRDYLEYVLPFLALFKESGSHALYLERLQGALPDLQRALDLNRNSVLAPFFMGLACERLGRAAEALDEYRRAAAVSADCYPAVLGLARVLESQGQQEEAIRLLQDMVTNYPDNGAIKRQLAGAYYRSRDWSRAEPAIAEILQRDSRDAPLILMRAHVLVEQNQFLQAQAPLDLYGAIDANSRLYLFLRARVQAEGYRNRDSAITYLRALLRTWPDDTEASVYAARLLLESTRREDQAEGREILQRLLANDPADQVKDLAVQDAIRREAWKEAQTWLAPLLSSRRSGRDLLNAYTIERGLGNAVAAFQAARELYEREGDNEDAVIAYISALIDTGRQNEALRTIETRLANTQGGALKGRYYYLRSRLRTSDDAILADLRASLFEDPRNLSSIIAMFEIYRRRRDDRRAVYYLKQALALAPDNPQLRRWEVEYAGMLN
ncbi:hypothetical protein FACS1894124_0500 [Spirochaetia bacterium]|nr:hypothetical protein FACS1894124_0500 [Spirochaetia bacterium]